MTPLPSHPGLSTPDTASPGPRATLGFVRDLRLLDQLRHHGLVATESEAGAEIDLTPLPPMMRGPVAVHLNRRVERLWRNRFLVPCSKANEAPVPALTSRLAGVHEDDPVAADPDRVRAWGMVLVTGDATLAPAAR